MKLASSSGARGMADIKCPKCGAEKDIESREMTIYADLVEEEVTGQEGETRTGQVTDKDSKSEAGFLGEEPEEEEKDNEDEFSEGIYAGVDVVVYKCLSCKKIFLTFESIRFLKKDFESAIDEFTKEYSPKGYSPGISPGSVWAWLLGLI